MGIGAVCGWNNGGAPGGGAEAMGPMGSGGLEPKSTLSCGGGLEGPGGAADGDMG